MTGKFTFNPDKCFVMRLTHARNIKQFNCTLGNTTLQETDSHSIIPRNMHNQRLKLEQTYTSYNSLSKPHHSIHQTQPPLMLHKHQNNSLHNPSPTTLRILIFSMGPHIQALINQIEMVQRRAARFCLNDYAYIHLGKRSVCQKC